MTSPTKWTPRPPNRSAILTTRITSEWWICLAPTHKKTDILVSDIDCKDISEGALCVVDFHGACFLGFLFCFHFSHWVAYEYTPAQCYFLSTMYIPPQTNHQTTKQTFSKSHPRSSVTIS
jgi:hypothetical protein